MKVAVHGVLVFDLNALAGERSIGIGLLSFDVLTGLALGILSGNILLQPFFEGRSLQFLDFRAAGF